MSPIARAVSSIGLQPCEENTYGVRAAVAPRAMCTSLSGRISSPAPTGASISGARSGVPSTLVVRSRRAVPCSIRGTIRQREKASRLCRIVVPSPAPPATYAQARRDIAFSAAASNAAASVGTSGVRPSTPAR